MQQAKEIENELAKSDDNKFKKENSKEFQNTIAIINKICKSISKPSDKYKPEETVKILVDYLKSEVRMQRILYSEISSYLFTLPENKLGNFLSNIDVLLCFSLDKSKELNLETGDKNGAAVSAEDTTTTEQKERIFSWLVDAFFGTKRKKEQPASDAAPEIGEQPASDAAPEIGEQPASDAAPETEGQPASDTMPVTSGDISLDEDVKKLIIKIYDHTQLVNYQIESIQTIFNNSIEGEMKSFRDQTKDIEKEYITILGIFASIIIAFVGSFTFSTSVLSNISEVDFERLMIIALFIGLAFFNLIAYLIEFLRDISSTKKDAKDDKKGNKNDGNRNDDEQGKCWRICFNIAINAIIIFAILYFMHIGGYLKGFSTRNAGEKTSDPDKLIETVSEANTALENSETASEANTISGKSETATGENTTSEYP